MGAKAVEIDSPQGVSISVLWTAILLPCFPVMARFTKRLHIFHIPEQLRIASMWFNMIHNSCSHILSFLLASHTKRMCFQIVPTELLPPAAIASLPCRPGFLWMQLLVRFTILLSVRNQFRASRMSAWCLRSSWHTLCSFPSAFLESAAFVIPSTLLMYLLPGAAPSQYDTAVQSAYPYCISNRQKLSSVPSLKPFFPAPFYTWLSTNFFYISLAIF